MKEWCQVGNGRWLVLGLMGRLRRARLCFTETPARDMTASSDVWTQPQMRSGLLYVTKSDKQSIQAREHPLIPRNLGLTEIINLKYKDMIPAASVASCIFERVLAGRWIVQPTTGPEYSFQPPTLCHTDPETGVGRKGKAVTAVALQIMQVKFSCNLSQLGFNSVCSLLWYQGKDLDVWWQDDLPLGGDFHDVGGYALTWLIRIELETMMKGYV